MEEAATFVSGLLHVYGDGRGAHDGAGRGVGAGHGEGEGASSVH